MLRKTGWIIPLTFLASALFFFRTNQQLINDTYWHLSVGREVAQTKGIPNQDNFVYGEADTHYTPSEWLSGLIYYEAFAMLSGLGFPLIRLIMGVAVVYFFYRTLLLFTSNQLSLGFGLLLVSYVISFSLNNRPEIFSIAFIVLINYICISYYTKKSLPKIAFSLPFVFLAWPNIHPYSIIGLGLLTTFYILIFTSQHLQNLKFKDLKVFTILILISLLASAIQYQRVLVFAQANQLQFIAQFANLKDRILPGGYLGKLTGEIYLYFITATIYLISLIKNKKFDPLGIFYFFILAAPIKYYRLIPISLLLAWPYLFKTTKNPVKISFLPFNKFLYIFAVIIITVSALTSNIPLAQNGNDNQFSPPRTEKFIRQNLDTKRLFTLSNWNDYFIWSLKDVKTFSDAMPTYRTRESLLDENYLVRPDNDPQELLAKYNIDTIVNTQTSARWQSHTNVANRKNWQLVYINEGGIIYARNDVIKNKVLDLSLINPYEKSDLKFDQNKKDEAIEQVKNLLKFDWENDFARTQLVLYYLYENQLKEAEGLAIESKNISDNKAGYSYLLAIIFANKNDCNKSLEFANEAVSKNPNEENRTFLKNFLRAKCSIEIK